MNRASRTAVAQETVRIADRGWYDLSDGRRIDIADAVRRCLEGTRFFPPEDLNRLRREALARPADAGPTAVEVRNETTLAGLARLLTEGGGPVAALNFASAKNPGGGFLGGAQAQEESLARSSALYASLLQAPEYYRRHRASRSALYTDAMILSPDCPIIRDDDGDLIEPLTATFITSPAPNAGAVAKNAPEEWDRIPDVLRRRSEYVLALAAMHGYQRLVLGAWGCGVFGNDPDLVAGSSPTTCEPACGPGSSGGSCSRFSTRGRSRRSSWRSSGPSRDRRRGGCDGPRARLGWGQRPGGSPRVALISDIDPCALCGEPFGGEDAGRAGHALVVVGLVAVPPRVPGPPDPALRLASPRREPM